MKKFMKLGFLAIMGALLVACSGGSTGGFDTSKNITVISRENGSGTRGAFIELVGVESKNSAGEKVDQTTADAEIVNSTSIMMTSVASNDAAIGYISLGSLNDTVKAVSVDNVAATAANIENGTYKVARPFNVATKAETSEATKDFMNYMLSTEGQAVVTENKYIALTNTTAFTTTQPSGSITIAGSSSVTPLMEKLKEGYAKVNPNTTINIQQSDSTTGMKAVIDGIADIGMASREVKDSEKSAGVEPTVIAKDGIAVIVNKENPTENLSAEQIKDIYTGKTTTWKELA